SGNNFGAILSS
nr:Chain A, hIAPP(residues 19-29)S20G [Homo sapiens]